MTNESTHNEKQDPATAVGHIPSGLFIVCAQNPETKIIDGYLASWVQQVSFEPLLISLAAKPGRPAYDLIKSGETFTINVVGDHEKNYLKHFWSGYDPEKNPFEKDVPHDVSPNGGILMKEAKSVIECQLDSMIDPGDHSIVIAKVLESYINDDDAKPTVHVRKTGATY